MKPDTEPHFIVEPDLRAAIDTVLGDGESLGDFVDASLRDAVQRRREQQAFVARGLRALEAARQSGDYVDADSVLQSLQDKLDTARARQQAAKTTDHAA